MSLLWAVSPKVGGRRKGRENQGSARRSRAEVQSLDSSSHCRCHISVWTPGASRVSQANVELLTPRPALLHLRILAFSHTPGPTGSFSKSGHLSTCCSPALTQSIGHLDEATPPHCSPASPCPHAPPHLPGHSLHSTFAVPLTPRPSCLCLNEPRPEVCQVDPPLHSRPHLPAHLWQKRPPMVMLRSKAFHRLLYFMLLPSA